MTPEQALAAIQAATQWDFTHHCIERMMQRGATKADIKHAVANAHHCEPSQTHPDAWMVTGLDRDAEELTCSIVIEFVLTGATRNVVITVF